MELVFFFFSFLHFCIVVLFYYCLTTLLCLVGWLAWCMGFIPSGWFFSFHFIRFHFISCYTYSSGFVLFVEYYSEF